MAASPERQRRPNGDFVMEVKADAVQADVAEVWVKRQHEIKPLPRIKPVKETEAAVFRKEDKQDSRNKKSEGPAELDPGAVRKMAEKTQAYLDDLRIKLDFEVYEETGDMVIRIFNRETEELLREIPPEDLLELHQKVAELRGVLFDEKV
jgi:flagellar protein FlaG